MNDKKSLKIPKWGEFEGSLTSHFNTYHSSDRQTIFMECMFTVKNNSITGITYIYNVNMFTRKFGILDMARAGLPY